MDSSRHSQQSGNNGHRTGDLIAKNKSTIMMIRDRYSGTFYFNSRESRQKMWKKLTAVIVIVLMIAVVIIIALIGRGIIGGQSTAGSRYQFTEASFEMPTNMEK